MTVLRAAAIAGAVSGVPSTVHALVTGRDPLAAARAAGSMAPAGFRRRVGPLASGIAVHAIVSLGWTVVLDRVLPPRHRAWWGAIAGLGIAALDLGVLGRRSEVISALPTTAQIADHLAFGVVASIALRRDATTPTSTAGGPGLDRGAGGTTPRPSSPRPAVTR